MKRPALAILSVAAGVLCAVTVSAHESADRSRHDSRKGPDFAAMHSDMCKDRFARAVGRAAYLEARLSPTAAQEPLFSAWKTAMLQNADADAKTCAAMTPPSTPPSVVDAMTHEEARLESRLNGLHAELPALTALYQSLTAEQRRAFDEYGAMPDGGPHGRRFVIMRTGDDASPMPPPGDDGA